MSSAINEPRSSLPFMPIIWIVALVALCTVPFYVLHRNSFCISEWRFVPDAEIIDAALSEEIRFLNVRAALPDPDYLPFKDKQEFLSFFPSCCKILRGAEERRRTYQFFDFSDVLFGYYGSAVEIKYLLKMKNKKGEFVESPVAPINVVDSCGRAGVGENDIKDYYLPDELNNK